MKLDYDDENEEVYDIQQDYDFDDDLLAGDIVKDCTALAKQYVDSYFQDKDFHSGGEVPKHFLHSRISQVLNTDINRGVKTAYKALEPTVAEEDRLRCKQFGVVTEDIKFVNEKLNELAVAGIPKVFAAGILLMYLEFCLDVKC
jgi:hypothetical protein